MEGERGKYWSVASPVPQPGTEPTTQAYVLTGNWTGDGLVCGEDAQSTETHWSERGWTVL